ncbi:MAG: alpha/beta hydrolase-fold protein [Saprospiraceae bacterium]
MLRHLFLVIVSAFLAAAGNAQLTIQIYALPPSSPQNPAIFIAGNFNGWNPGDPAFKLQKDGYNYFLDIHNLQPSSNLEFKFTMGSWDTVEGGKMGNFLSNRSHFYTGGKDTVRLAIDSWENRDPLAGSTASPNVKIIARDFYIPQLNRLRRIWIYLPPDYATSKKRYPVIYLHDGQNLFDRATSFSGEWGVDETLDRLTGRRCIAVGIDNGGAHRMAEYSPWPNRFGAGEGKAYAAFIANDLKPYIDKHYRTLKSRRHTGIMGSSMGGLISLFTAVEYQQTFGFAGVLSPSLWIDEQWKNHIRQTGRKKPLRFYLLAGKYESDTMESQVLSLAETLRQSGFDPAQIAVGIDADGTHSEWYWARELPGVLKWWLGE